ncbi:hypothetical protein CI1B_49920 [Bradyrhizobium ivorense]|uniref:Uncharacterized protein n=1 Tax=Bradyrhizobium ivorense TaxID=2511166 RepID=A0A508TFS7_9BRAD|nr:hypothetical protein CI1B_49920 [Bradyrhizobium ivorense]VIO80737.1 hypothetical protein CI41S_74860 [Bradyrhizobium ivorense]
MGVGHTHRRSWRELIPTRFALRAKRPPLFKGRLGRRFGDENYSAACAAGFFGGKRP